MDLLSCGSIGKVDHWKSIRKGSVALEISMYGFNEEFGGSETKIRRFYSFIIFSSFIK